MVRVCAFAGFPGGKWQIVHLFGSLAPTKSGVAVGVGPAAVAVQRAKEKRTQARTARIDAPIRRNNCAPFETISNFFIKAFLRWQQVSYQRATAVNRNPHGFPSAQRSTSNQRATGIEPAWPAWKAGTLPLSYARADSASPARTKVPRACETAKRFFPRSDALDLSITEV